jgi:hypothetical protein
MFVFIGKAAANIHVSQKFFVKISSQDIPYKGDPGTYEQIYKIKLPVGQLIIQTNINNGTILFLSKDKNKKEKLFLLIECMYLRHLHFTGKTSTTKSKQQQYLNEATHISFQLKHPLAGHAIMATIFLS